MKINGFVLAGGKSTRMEQDKAMLDWHGRPLLNHMTDLLAGAVGNVQVAGRDGMPDRSPGCGPLGGIVTLLEMTETDTNLVVAVDLPFLTLPFLEYFRGRLETSKSLALACNIESRFPLCLGVRRGALPIANERIEAGKLSVHGFLAECGAEVISESELQNAGFGPAIFRNINTPEQYLRLRKLEL